MYGWLWRTLPGRWPLKTLQSLVLFFGVCVLLLLVVFPWVEPKLPFSDNVVDGSVPASTAEPTDAATGDAPAGDDEPGGGDDEEPADDSDDAGSTDDSDDSDDGGDQVTLPGEG